MFDRKKLIQDLKSITGKKYILTTEWSKNPYCKGWRFGEGVAIAVAKPGTLLEIWEILKTCVEMDTCDYSSGGKPWQVTPLNSVQ